MATENIDHSVDTRMSIKRLSSKRIGTHYGVFIEDLLIHYEFSQSAAERVLTHLKKGKTLYEIINEEIKDFHARKNLAEKTKLEKEIASLKGCLEKRTSNAKKKQKELGLPPIPPKVAKVQNPRVKAPKRIYIKPEGFRAATTPPTRRKLFPQRPQRLFSPKRLARDHELSKIEAEELSKLIIEVRGMGFTYSRDLSLYIKNNRLGDKYPHISGIVIMQDHESSWEFEGGFPKKIYRIICGELGLKSQESSAEAVDFIPYEDITS